MKPIGPLMVEHRLIERMLSLMSKELDRIKPDVKVNLDFIVSAIDFIQMYTEKTHFGKEEDILFKELDKRTLAWSTCCQSLDPGSYNTPSGSSPDTGKRYKSRFGFVEFTLGNDNC